MSTLEDESNSLLAVFCYDALYGAERANCKVLQLLSQRGYKVHCIVSDSISSELALLLRQSSFTLHEVKYGPPFFGLTFNPIHYIKNFGGMIRVSRLVSELCDEIDPTVIYAPNYIQFLYGFFAFWRHPRPVVFRLGDPPDQNILHGLMWRRVIAPYVDAFVANSESTCRLLLNHGIPESKAIVINNCPTRDWNATDEIERDPLRILYVGQLTPEKGVEIAVDAAIDICAERPNVVIEFLGGNLSSEYARQMLDLVASLGLSRRIIFSGFVADPREAYFRAGIHICPSLQPESSANVVLEAKMAGIPSVVFNRGGLPELLDHLVNGYLCADCSVNSLKQGIEYLLDNPTLRTEMGVRARESCSDYDEGSIGKRWKASVDSVLMDSGR
jgi:glycosyltransferase involved in cell wall biosynthesis